MRYLLYLLLGLAVAVVFARVASARDERCDVRLSVELTPDVPDASDPGFLSSLLSNHPGYRLELLRQDDPSLIELDLSGPGPDYLCRGVIETMRRDGRVLAIRVRSAPAQPDDG